MWDKIAASLITNLGIVGLLTVLVMIFGKKWLEAKINKSVEHGYSKSLEEHKANLQKQVNQALHDMQIQNQSQKEKVERDKVLYEKFIQIFPSTGNFIEIIKSQGMNLPISSEILNCISYFLKDWNNAEHEFLDPELESKKTIFYKNLDEFNHSFAVLCGPVFNGNDIVSYRIPLEREWRIPEQYYQSIEKLDNLANNVYNSYDDLIRSVRHKLIC